jgi:tetratricopeptide (TPR) repeat protein
MFKFSKEGIDRATELLHSTLDTIGDNALLFAALSYASWAAYDFGIYYEEDTLSRGEQYAAKALELDPDQPLAHYADGLMRYKRGDLEAMIRSARYAVELEPTGDALFFLAFCLAGVGKIEEAKQFGDESVARDPLFFITILGRAVVDLFSGSFDAALDRIRDGRDRLAPGDPFANWWLAKTLAYGGHEKEAHALFKQVAAQDTGFWSDHCRLLQKALEDDREGVLEVLSNTGLRSHASTDEIYPICLANALTRVGEIDEALKWVDQSVSWGFTNYRFLSEHNPFLAPLRDNPKFRQIMERARQRQEAFSF